MTETAASGGQSAGERKKMKVAALMSKFRGWSLKIGEETISTNPTKEELDVAVSRAKAGELEMLVFDSPAFHAEFDKIKTKGRGEVLSWTKKYHANRVAYFVEKGWDESPIEIMPNGDLREGQHRLLAACFMEIDEVDIYQVQG